MKYKDLYKFYEENKDSLSDLGLMLEEEPIEWDYDSTPSNSKTFATTGGDGVHFSFLTEEGSWNEKSPIVMTVPMNWDETNFILGKDIKEFLELGVYFGYFSLEQLAYDYEGTIEEIESSQDYEHDPTLKKLQENLNLKPWGNISQRLKVLKDTYLNKLIVEE